jgi:uncharacterized protein YggE
MRRSTLAVVAVSVLVLAACASSGEPPVVNVNGTGAGPNGITVNGTGEVTGTPDTVEVSLGVAVLAENVQEATTTAAQKADALIAALTDGGVDPKDITTAEYSIYPEYDYSSNTERLVGYRVSNTVRVKIRNVDDTGALIDAATAAGGNDIRVNSLQFSIDDDAEMVKAARAAAWEDAMAKATQLAELSGQELGAAISINETVSSTPPPVYYERAALDAAGAETPIEPGTSAVTISLSVNFTLGA